MASETSERCGQAVAVKANFDEKAAGRWRSLGALRRLTWQTTPAWKHHEHDLAAGAPFARERGVPARHATPLPRCHNRRRLATRRDDTAIAAQQRDRRQLITRIGPDVVEHDPKRVGILGPGQPRRPLDVPHSFLGDTACFLKREAVRNVPVVEDGLNEQGDGQRGARRQQHVEPHAGMPLLHVHDKSIHHDSAAAANNGTVASGRRSGRRNRWRSAARRSVSTGQRRLPDHVLCRRAKEQEVGRATPLHAHDDQITVLFCGDAQHLAPGLSMRHHRLHAAELGRAGDGFVKTPT